MSYFNKLYISIFFLLSGCVPSTHIAQKEVVYVGIPIPCNVPDVICDFKGSWLEPTQKLIECIKEQKMIIQACSGELPPEHDLSGIDAKYQYLGSTTY